MRAVAEIASWLAGRIAERGEAVDRPLVEAAALLHDVDKLLPQTPGDPWIHGLAGADWLVWKGHAELAPAVATHPVFRLAEDDGDRIAGPAAPLEVRIVAYADKRAGQQIEPMASRFAGWARRYPHGWSGEVVEVARRRAELLEADVCRRAGVAPAGVRRLRWTGAALAEGRARRETRWMA